MSLVPVSVVSFWRRSISASNRREHALHAGPVEVGDDIDAMRQLLERLERAAALEVHQDEVQDAGIVVERQPDDQRHQQLRLARSRAAGNQAMDAVLLGLQVHLARAVARHQAEGDLQPVGRGGLAALGPLAPGDLLELGQERLVQRQPMLARASNCLRSTDLGSAPTITGFL